jgi:hypothetical protein
VLLEMESTIELGEPAKAHRADEKKAMLDDNRPDMIESTVSLLMMEQIAAAPFLIATLCSGVQFATYIVLLTNVQALTSEKLNYGAVAIASIYASIAIANEGYEQFMDIMLGFAFNAKTEKINLARLAILGMESCNMVLLFLATVFTVPAQADALSIILNCTAIIAISKIDDGMFTALRMRAKKCSKIAEVKDEALGKYGFRLALKLLYFLGAGWVFLYLVCVLYVNSTTTQAPTFMPTASP